MSNILPNGSVNPNSLIAPGVYIAETLPTPTAAGVPTNIIGIVGTASWGAVNSPQFLTGIADSVRVFGVPTTNDFDLGTQVMGAASVGATAFQCVRVTDGTDDYASVDLLDVASPTPVVGATLTARYTGTVGNSISVIVSQGTNSTLAAPTFRVQIFLPVGVGASIPETFDNIGGTGAARWTNLVNAINMGQGTQVPPSQLVTAIVGLATAAPELDTYTLTGGTDGSLGVVVADLIGLNTQPLTGMYSLSGTQFDLLVLSNVTDDTTFIEQSVFSQTNGAYAMLSMPSGGYGFTGIDAAITSKKTIGLDHAFAKLLIGDWVQIQDRFNQVARFISQQSFSAGILSTLPPNEVGLNKNIQSTILVGTQSSVSGYRYSQADKIQLTQNGLDVISNPSVGGFYFGLQTGKDTSSNALASYDNFPRLTNFIAFTVSDLLGPYIGRPNNPSVVQSSVTAVSSYLTNLELQQIIGSSKGGKAYDINVDESLSQNGILIMNVRVAFFGVIAVILVNLQTGLSQVSSVQPE